MGNTPLTIQALINRGKWDDYRQGIWGNSYTWHFARPTTSVQYLAMHHSVTHVYYRGGDGKEYNTARKAWTPRQFADEIANIHRIRGWAGVGYHLIIVPDGTVLYVGDVSTGRANIANHNEKVIGICMVGDFTKHLPTDDQILSAHDLTWFFVNNRGVWPNLKPTFEQAVMGHKELNVILGNSATACPGSSWPNDMKDRIKNKVVYTPQPIPQPTPTPQPTPIPSPTPPPPSDPCPGMILETECDLRMRNLDTNWKATLAQKEEQWKKEKADIIANLKQMISNLE